MNNEELNTALYKKMFAEQDKFRDWLRSQAPEEILQHTYEYTVREDILLSLEYHDLTDTQAQALLESPDTMSDLFHAFEKLETGYMDTVWESVEDRANEVIREKQGKVQEKERPSVLEKLQHEPYSPKASGSKKREPER